MAIWAAGLVATVLTGAAAFMILPLALACAGLAAIAADWHGIAKVLWSDSGWPHYRSLSLTLFRWTFGGAGLVVCVVVTVADCVAAFS